MSAINAASLYVGVNILIAFALIIGVIVQRRKHKVALGDGDQPSLKLAIRAHANAVEVMPLALIGLVTLAIIGSSATTIHILGGALTIGRALHAYGLSNSGGTSFGRMAGMALSLLALLGTATTCLIAAF